MDIASDPELAVPAKPRALPAYLPRAASFGRCRFCNHELRHVMADLGMQPVANAYRAFHEVNRMEPFFPLRALVCQNCLLVQAQEFETAENMFSEDYAYFSSFSDSWLRHARNYADMAIQRFNLDEHSRVVEIACNDGYLLRWFVDKGIPSLGIEPTAGTARAAAALGIPVHTSFFGADTAYELRAAGVQADLMPANNVVAHVPDINDFIEGFRVLLKDNGVATFEFHHVMNLLGLNQFDTIYHEHYYYHSLATFQKILASHSLAVFDVEQLPTHGGSLRVYAQHTVTGVHAISPRVGHVLAQERAAGLDRIETYLGLNERVRSMKLNLLATLIEAKRLGKRIAAYGAPAKGNTLLNFAGVRNDFIDFTVDRNPAKQQHMLPGTMIPILSPDTIFESKPDLLLVLVWNLLDEVREQMAGIREWGGRFLVAMPDVRILD
ncbi:MAG: class I SAM-dependent methyltransferase [Burkholderiaceae bacterium]